MPRDTVLRGHDVKAASAPVPNAGENGEPVIEMQYVLIFRDRQTSDTIRVAFDKETRDYIVRELTGGIVLHGGELPKL